VEYGVIKQTKHYVFDDIEEYNDYHMELFGAVPIIKEWRKADEGDWVWTEDDILDRSSIDHKRIVQILKRGCVRNNKKWGWCRTVVGSFVQNKFNYMDSDFSQRAYPKQRYQFGRHNLNLTNKQRVKRREWLTKNEIHFCIRVATGGDPISVYQEIYKTQSFHKTRDMAIFLLRQERIMDKISESVQNVALSLGIDHRTVLQNYLDLFEESKDEDFKFKINEKLGLIIGTESGNKRVTTTFGAGAVFGGFSQKELEGAIAEEE